MRANLPAERRKKMTIKEKLIDKTTLLRPEGNTSGTASGVIPELVPYIKLSDVLEILAGQVEPVVKPACETDKENIKYTCHYGKPIKYRTSFDI